ncbi:D-sedoheptulose 7-phosphate isomerase [Oceanibaculum sp.]|uniref:D-sedoheptulose 7-phosphate isomerase n=1 Tax=Oceanibaculum sp. TaxID=1903597 RepID=UPI002589A1CD|nr:D-sedoheptulose 7-phosphate isomerase [Oceanibaculum sp.]MCH2394118.1 D-sedoheptulose 7-phosphate isomerase [Oceanibaculum sp.]
MDLASFYAAEFTEHAAVTAATREALAQPFAVLVDSCCTALNAGGKIIFFGNGGSAADAQHLATELSVRYITDRKAIPALALTTDSSALTAIGNDLGFEQLFARQIEALCRKEDMVIGISTSGRSANVTKGLQAARAIGARVAALSGKNGGDLVGLADPLLIVPSSTTARIQEMHIMLGQMLCGAIEKKLGLAS